MSAGQLGSFIYGNYLRILPENLPEGLKSLTAEGNRLQSLPTDLPETLS
jgi:Leucine-rich repeat (LRR) protein